MRAYRLYLLPAACALILSGCSTLPPGAQRVQACHPSSEAEVAALFEQWNQSLQTGDARQVAAHYAEGSILLPTVSNKVRLSAAEKIDYFEHFLVQKPIGKIDFRRISLGCNTAVDAGLYTFTYRTTGAVVNARYTYTYAWDGKQWGITSHHSSGMPEKVALPVAQ